MHSVDQNRIYMQIRLNFDSFRYTYIRYLQSSKKSSIHKTWPPHDTFELFLSSVGTHSLSLKPWVDITQKIRNPTLSYIHQIKALSNDSKVNISDLEELVQLDKRHRIDAIYQNLQIYPKALDLHAVVSAIRSGKPVDQEPLNDPELLIIQTPEMSCVNLEGSFSLDHRPYKCDLIVMVKSCVSCQSARRHARLTYMRRKLWGRYRVEFVFVVGLPFISNSSSFIVDDVEVPSKQHVKTKKELEQQIRTLFEDSRLHKDILVGGFIDTYENLTMKTIFALRWASAFCKHCSPLFLFMDSDVSLIPRNFINLVKTFPDEAKTEIIGGFPYYHLGITRPTGKYKNHEHALSRKHYPWNHPPTYLFGHGYLLGSEKVRDGAIASAFVKSMKLEDVYLGIIWEKLNYKCLKLPGFLLYPSKPSDISRSVIAATEFADLHVNWETGELKPNRTRLTQSK
ncbi:unnamed protein product [Calicophoron daubneyi]|uniref:Hexosyltransferase n=1 Tax=Calicophoron daubneyi TaxID=300641 RepID=A0AAV2TFB4_CALDB